MYIYIESNMQDSENIFVMLTLAYAVLDRMNILLQTLGCP